MPSHSPIHRRARRLARITSAYVAWDLVLVLVLAAVFLAATLKTGYIADDALNSTFTGGLQMSNISALGLSNKIVKAWIVEQGRWFPLSFYFGYFEFHINHSLIVYKLLNIAGILLALGATWALMRSIRLSRPASSLVVLATIVTFQLRESPDPILSYGQLMAFTWIQIAFSLLLFQKWLTGGRLLSLAGALLLLATACSTYESAYLLAPVYFVLAARERGGLIPGLKATSPIIVESIGFILLGSYLRSQAIVGSGGPYAPNLDLGEVFYTATDQLLAAIPLTYRLLDPHVMFDGSILNGLSLYSVVAGAAVSAAALLLAKSSSAQASSEQIALWPLALIGLLVWVLTGAPVGLATRYQAELIGGIGHVPVFLGYIGIGMVLAAAGALIVRRFGTVGLAVLAVGAGVITAVTHSANDVVIARTIPAKQARDAETEALHRGLLRAVTPGSTLYLGSPTIWQNGGYYRQEGGVPLNTAAVEAYDPNLPDPRHGGCSSPYPGRLWTSTDIVNGEGMVSLTCLDESGSGTTLIYLRGFDPAEVTITAQRRTTEPSLPRDGIGGRGNCVLAPVTGSPGIWVLRSRGAIDPSTLHLDRNPPEVLPLPPGDCSTE